jgi:hypothetical protein
VSHMGIGRVGVWLSHIKLAVAKHFHPSRVPAAGLGESGGRVVMSQSEWLGFIHSMPEDERTQFRKGERKVSDLRRDFEGAGKRWEPPLVSSSGQPICPEDAAELKKSAAGIALYSLVVKFSVAGILDGLIGLLDGERVDGDPEVVLQERLRKAVAEYRERKQQG